MRKRLWVAAALCALSLTPARAAEAPPISRAPIPTPFRPASAIALSDNPWGARRPLTDAQAEAAMASLDLKWRPANEELKDRDIVDGYLALRNWRALAQRFTTGRMPDVPEEGARWARPWIDHGGPLMLDVVHVGLLMTASRFSSGAKQAELRREAVVFALYGYALTEFDGLRCADSTAPKHWREELAATFKAVMAYGRGLSATEKAKVKAELIDLEARTAPLRTEDPELCSNDLLAVMEAGTAQKVPAPPGGFGQTYALTAPPRFKPPQYRPEAEWRAEFDKRRAELGQLADVALGAAAAKP